MTELVGPRLYSCCNCRNHVALHDNVISKAFQRRSGSSRSNPSLKSWRGLLRQLRSSRLSGPDIFDRPIRLMKNSYAHISSRSSTISTSRVSCPTASTL
ncbi:hypothetical protein ACFX1T_026944 [Malus domestica]